MAQRTKDWADEPEVADRGRRNFLRATLLAGGAVVVGAAVSGAGSLIPPPIKFTGTVDAGFRYGHPDSPTWYSALAGQPVKTTDFKLWEGASTLWRAVFDDSGAQIPGSGYPALVICVDAKLLSPPAATNPYIVPVTVGGVDAAIVALYDRCVHLCCLPGWHVSPVPADLHDYIVQPKTLSATDPATGAPDPQDPIWCQCHNSQYDPVTIVPGLHPAPANVSYFGAQRVHGPATRALPAIPLKTSGTILQGLYDPADGGHPDWYSAYCQ